MIGKEAWDFINKYKDIIETVTIVDVEYDELKCFYIKDIEDVLNDPHWFKSDITDDWEEYDEYAYTMIYEVSFNNSANIDLTKMTTRYALENNIVDKQGRYIK